MLGDVVRQIAQQLATVGLADGGGDGALGRFSINSGGADARALSAAEREEPLPHGTVLRVETPGGGGWGDPESRDGALSEKDRREDRVARADDE